MVKNNDKDAEEVVLGQQPSETLAVSTPVPSQAAAQQVTKSFPETVMIHIDDFLNSLDSTGRIELLSAFGKIHIASGHVKETEEKWKKLLDEFIHATS